MRSSETDHQMRWHKYFDQQFGVYSVGELVSMSPTTAGRDNNFYYDFIGGTTSYGCGMGNLSGGWRMLLWLAVVLAIAWALGFVVFHVAGGLIHLLLVVAIIVFIFNFVS